MPREHQDRDAIVTKAIGIASEEVRAAYIAQACDSNAELKHQVEEQVAAHFQNDSRNGVGRVAGAEDRELRSTRIGPYKVVKQIGESASSIVFQAEQQEPVRLKVALKVIKHGPDWRQVVDRFEAERQVLSRLEHPNLAKVIGAGTRQTGQPYFVMEWVDGLPLTKYCDEHRQTLQQRLELFIFVCQAVQYAHQKGIIHGDLKPANVLVSNRDDKPAAKILDLGVAKAVRQKPSEDAPFAGPGGLGDKPEYLSPEQADPDDADIDTRSDIYNLGVLLYELVTGTTPLTGEQLQDVSLTETLRLIREEEVPAPSARLNESKDRLASVAAKRQMKPNALVKAVTGDLDCVVLKALHKDRTHRYETVNELMRDLHCYLAKEPVEACTHGTQSQLRTAARQHPRAKMTVLVMLLFLFLVAGGGVGLAVWEWRQEKQARKAEHQAVQKRQEAEKEAEKTKGKLKRAVDTEKERARERNQAQEAEQEAKHAEQESKAILSFLKHKLLATGRPGDVSLANAFWAGSRGSQDATVRKGLTLRQAVDEAEAQVAKTFADRPSAEASVREMLGLAYLNLGEPAQAVKQYERALDLWQGMQGANHPDRAECLNQLAVAYRLAGRDADAARLYHRNPNSPAHARALAISGSMLLSQKKPAEAELKLRECLTIRQKIQADDWITFDTKSLLGEALLKQKKYAEAERLLLSAYKGLKHREDKVPAQDKDRIIKAVERLVRLYQDWGKKDDAAKWRNELDALKATIHPKSSG